MKKKKVEKCISCRKILERKPAMANYMSQGNSIKDMRYSCDECACYYNNYCEYLSEDKIKEIRNRDGSAQKQYISLSKEWWQFWK